MIALKKTVFGGLVAIGLFGLADDLLDLREDIRPAMVTDSIPGRQQSGTESPSTGEAPGDSAMIAVSLR
jgi:hypothetical protein